MGINSSQSPPSTCSSEPSYLLRDGKAGTEEVSEECIHLAQRYGFNPSDLFDLVKDRESQDMYRVSLKSFGSLLKSLRLVAGYGLREFANLISEHPSNLSAIESGSRSPWGSQKRLLSVADTLGLRQGSYSRDIFFTSAFPGSLPPDLVSVTTAPSILRLLRCIRDLKYSDKDVIKVIESLSR